MGSLLTFAALHVPEAFVAILLGQEISRVTLVKRRLLACVAAFSVSIWVLQILLPASPLRALINGALLITILTVVGKLTVRPTAITFAVVFVGEALGEILTIPMLSQLGVSVAEALRIPWMHILLGWVMLLPAGAALAAIKWSRRDWALWRLPVDVDASRLSILALTLVTILASVIIISKALSQLGGWTGGLALASAPSPLISLGIAVLSTATCLVAVAATTRENARKMALEQRLSDELRASNEQLIHAERYRALGEMAGAMAHAFNNILAGVRSRAQLAQMTPGLDESTRADLARILHSIDDAAEFTAKIRSMGQSEHQLDVEPLRVSEIVQRSMPVERCLVHKVRLHQSLLAHSMILGSRVQLMDALMNIMNNACDAVAGFGDVWVELTENESHCLVEVRDNGPGISEEDLSKVFIPFFSTKGPTGGMGLGLCIARKAIERHGGDIAITSAPGVGTCVKITFPVATEAGGWEGKPASEVMERPSLAGLHVIIVDDNREAAEAAAEYLGMMGCVATVRTEPHETARLVRETPPADVVTDLTMPCTSGLEIAQAYAALGVPVILVTGWDGQIDAESLSSHGVTLVMPKPFDLPELGWQVSRLARKEPATNPEAALDSA